MVKRIFQASKTTFLQQKKDVSAPNNCLNLPQLEQQKPSQQRKWKNNSVYEKPITTNQASKFSVRN